jgi:phosphate butyryltransferase
MIGSMRELVEQAKSLPGKRVVIAAAQDEAALGAAVEAERIGLAEPLLVGVKAEIERTLEKLGAPKDKFEIVVKNEEMEAVGESVRLIREGRAHVLLKGKTKTGTLLKAVLDKERGLRTDRLLSDVFIFDCPFRREHRIMGVTDGGITPVPTLEQKVQITKNAVEAFHSLGYEKPKVAHLSAIETVSPGIQSTVDAAEIAGMYKKGELENCIVDGPLAFDLAVSKDAAEMKSFVSPVAGEADILIGPTIEASNILAKSLMYTAPFEPGHVIVGARAPVLICSRSESSEAKLNAIAFGCLMAHWQEETH